ncbi:MAG: dipeptide epimerase [Bacteroidetes bacterium]|nr:MAG: dipeptide epimerase [Bacteroidota bacterium]
MKFRYWSRDLKFTHPFTISKGTKTHQPTFIVELEFNGIKGYGEAPAITYYNIPVEKMIADLESKRSMVEKFAFTDPERYWHYLHHLFPQNSFLVCALDMASWDIWGKLKKMPLYKIWKNNPVDIPLTDFTIGIDNPDKMISKMGERPWPIYKIKLGTREDLELIKTLRQSSSAVFRVDANAGWKLEDAYKIIPVLKELEVELVEQPLAKDDWEGMNKLREFSPIPLIADEACVAETDVEKCKGFFHGINIKLTKCGGITPAKRMLEKAKSLGMKIMLGCMNESTIGTAAMIHLAPEANYLDADGPILLEEDIASGLEYNFGRVMLKDAPGLGIQVNL